MSARNVWYHGMVSGIWASRVQIPDTTQLFNGITVLASSGNLEQVYVGYSGVTTLNAPPLTPDNGFFIQTDSPSNVYVVSATGPTTVYWYGS